TTRPSPYDEPSTAFSRAARKSAAAEITFCRPNLITILGAQVAQRARKRGYAAVLVVGCDRHRSQIHQAECAKRDDRKFAAAFVSVRCASRGFAASPVANASAWNPRGARHAPLSASGTLV